MDITPDNPQQLSIFENSNPRHKPLMKTIDELNYLIITNRRINRIF